MRLIDTDYALKGTWQYIAASILQRRGDRHNTYHDIESTLWVVIMAHLRWLPHTDLGMFGRDLYRLIAALFDEYQIVYFVELKQRKTQGGLNKEAEITRNLRLRTIKFGSLTRDWYRTMRNHYKPFYKEDTDEDEGQTDEEDNEDEPDEVDQVDETEQTQQSTERPKLDEKTLEEMYILTRERLEILAKVWETARDAYGVPHKKRHMCNRFNHKISKAPVTANEGMAAQRSQNAATIPSNIQGSHREASRTSSKRKTDDGDGDTDEAVVSEGSDYRPPRPKKANVQKDKASTSAQPPRYPVRIRTKGGSSGLPSTSAGV